MKIAMIGHKRIPSREGGVEIVVEELATRMVAKGHRVCVYNRKGKKNLFREREYKGVQIVTVPTFEKKSLNAIVYAFLATIRAVFGHFDIIHFHAEGPCSMIWLPHLLGIRTVATIHGLDWQRAKWGGFATRFLLFGEKMAVKYADEIIVLSKNVQEYFGKTYQRETVFIPNGVGAVTIKETNIIYKKYGLSKDSYFLFLARLVPEKGVHYLIEAYRKINTNRKFVIAGGSSHSDGYVEELHRLVNEDKNIVFTGFVQGEELEELYSNAYVYILPSDIEGMPLSLLEALCYGNCCLVSDIPENMEVVEDKAISFRRSEVQSLSMQLQKLEDDPEKVSLYKKEAAEYIQKKYNWDDIVDQTVVLYKKDKK